MLSDVIVVALITGVCSVIGQWLISRKSAQDKAVADAVRNADINKRLEALEKKIDTHNGYAQRFAEIGEDIAVIKTKLESLSRS